MSLPGYTTEKSINKITIITFLLIFSNDIKFTLNLQKFTDNYSKFRWLPTQKVCPL